MTLSLGTGPLAGHPGGAFNFDLSGAPAHRIFFYDYPRRLRALVGDRVVLDTVGAKLLYETGLLPVPYAPLDDFDGELLERTDHTTHCPFKGDASYWTVRAGDAVLENALWAYEDPLPESSWLKGYGALYWKRATVWFVEEEPVFAHLRDPFHRVDVHESSRPVTVGVDGRVVARCERPKLLFETGLPARVYIPRSDVAPGVLGASEKRAVCPYKGHSHYWSVAGVEDAAWTYEAPLPDAIKVQGHVCFDDERVAVELGQPRAQLPGG
ncbi:MAG TPA: DUF427 domain-containing protein [Solirubrobacteraceae bacterium]|nr:DUF427 domain-containing protein [Solirubrobacteraceae bacterium]